MEVALLCGERRIHLEVPESVTVLETKETASLPEPAAAVRQALSQPTGTPPLKELARGRKNACVVISDITRPVPNRIILPPLLELLEESGIPKDRITLLIATGMHRPNLGEELASMVGRDLMDRYSIENHNCHDPKAICKVDEIEGVPIEVNRRYLEADLKILTGLIEPHFYAAYSGGGKSILPGISSFETMKWMHSYQMIDHPRVTNCTLEGNPFHDYVLRVTERVGADLILNVVINKAREVAGVFSGHYNLAHLEGCDWVRRHAVRFLEHPVDLVITSGGGYPLDATFYQISKALICARDILKKGGSILVTCECREGLGSAEFCEVLGSACSPQDFFERYCDPANFVIDQWCAQNIYQALDHAGQVYLYAPGLSHGDVANLNVIKIEGHLQETVDRLIQTHPEVAVAPDGPYVVGRLCEEASPR
jgi:nickel-dependent lactate racemase